MRFARKLHPELLHHRLKDMTAFFSAEPEREHRSIADCESTALCYDRLCREALQQFGDEEQFAGAFRKKHGAYIKAGDIEGDSALNDPDSPFFSAVSS